ncbi:hypothetical protein ACFE04_007082 [Oxalis oulophora]
MKSHFTTSSSTKSSTGTTNSSMGDDNEQIEGRDSNSCYFPGCLKDANCNCDICLDSFNATLDLIPLSVQKSSLSKFSSPRPINVEKTPVSFDSSIMSTPISNTPPAQPELVRRIGERSLVGNDLNSRLRLLQRGLQGVVEGKVSNCSYKNSPWKITQDGLLVNSRCTLYKSFVEEVSIWGWPLQTAGLLNSGVSSRSFTILSGRVTEWPEGKMGYLIRKTNSSWVNEKWGASAVQLDPNTWVLEYQRSFILEKKKLYSLLLEFLKLRLQRKAGIMKQIFHFGNKHSNTIPT